MKRGGKVWIDIFPDKPVTAKPADYTPKKDRADLPKYGKIELNK